jgi:hypothetical protein
VLLSAGIHQSEKGTKAQSRRYIRVGAFPNDQLQQLNEKWKNAAFTITA